MSLDTADWCIDIPGRYDAVSLLEDDTAFMPYRGKRQNSEENLAERSSVGYANGKHHLKRKRSEGVEQKLLGYVCISG